MTLLPVILSGGSGTRLWPLSSEKYHKQLLPLIGEESLLQSTLRRVEGISDVELAAPMVVCNEEYRFVIAEQLRLMGKEGVILLGTKHRLENAGKLPLEIFKVQSGSDPSEDDIVRFDDQFGRE
jgi:mannose-1-phosphate guanylyltransferase / mannose-6-phosphate isomerase